MAINLADKKATLEQQISKNSTRSNRYNVDAHLQGIEIRDINASRAALPVVGRNQRYKIIDQAMGTRAAIYVKLPTYVTPSVTLTIGGGAGNDALIPGAGDRFVISTNGDGNGNFIADKINLEVSFHTSGSWPNTFGSMADLGYSSSKLGYGIGNLEMRINNSLSSYNSCLEIANAVRAGLHSLTTVPVLHSGSYTVLEGFTVSAVGGSAGARTITVTAPTHASQHDFTFRQIDANSRLSATTTAAIPSSPQLSGSISFGDWFSVQHVNKQASSEENILRQANYPAEANSDFTINDTVYQKYPFVGLPVLTSRTGSLITSVSGSEWNSMSDLVNFVNLNDNLIATEVPDAAGGSILKIELQKYGDFNYTVLASGSIGLFTAANSTGYNPSTAGGENLKTSNFTGGVQVGQGNLSRNNYFTDIGTILDAGLGQDIVSGNQFDPLALGKPQLAQQSTTPSVANVKFPNSRYLQVINFELQADDYGFQKEYFDTTPFYDLSKFNAVDFINMVDPTGMFPVVGSFPNYDSSLQLNGIVEPLEIRRRMLGWHLFLESDRQPGAVSGDTNALEFPFHSRDVAEIKAAQFGGDNFTPTRALYFEDVASRGFYISGSLTAEGLAMSMLEPEYVADFDKSLPPFIDRGSSDLLPYDSAMSNAIVVMDPTVDEGILPEGHVDAATGFTGNARDRHNSTNFRGMFRR